MQVDGKLVEFYRQTAVAEGVSSACKVLESLADQVIGAKLFTLMTFDERIGKARRFYSNMPDAYPVSGTKDVESNSWSRHVLQQKKSFVANNIKGISEVFSDHDLIHSLGCESVVNIPVEVCGRVLGTINCLHEHNHYSPDRVEAAELLKLPAAVCFLLQKQNEEGGDR